MAKSWYQNMFSGKSAEIKALEKKLTSMQEELEDTLNYNTKFFDVEPSGFAGGNFNLSGVETTISPETLLHLFATESWVYSAVMAIAETIAGLPWKLKKRTVVQKKVRNEVTGAEEIVEQEVWTDVTGSKLFQLFQYPNKHHSRTEFLQLLLIDLIVTGDSYTYLHSDQDLSVFEEFQADDDANSTYGRLRSVAAENTAIKAMYRLPSMNMTPVPKKAEEGFGLHGYVMSSGEGQFAFLPSEIVHIKFPNPLNSWTGLSPLMAAIMKILLERYSTEHMMRFYKSGARLGGMIESEKNLTPEQITRLQRSFENDYTGRQNFYRTLILPQGMKYKTVEQNPVENTVIELMKANRESILSVLRVPPIKVGVMDNANYANANAQLKIFYDDTIKPRCAMITDAFNMKPSIMPDNRSYRLEFDFADVSVLQEPYKDKADAAKAMLEAGLSPNEVRKAIWKATPVEGGDKIKAVEDLNKPDPQPFPFFNRSADQDVDTKDGSGPDVNNVLATLPRTVSTSIMNIVGRVSSGKLAPEAGAAMIAAFGLPEELSHKLVGLQYTPPAPVIEAKSDVTPVANQPELSAVVSTNMTFDQRVAQLVQQMMATDKLSLEVAISRAIAQARAEGYDEDPTDPDGGGSKSEEKPSFEEFMAAALSTMDPEKSVDPAVLDRLVSDYERDYGPITEEQRNGLTVQDTSMKPEKVYGFGMSKDQVVTSWKGFIDKTEPMIAARKAHISAWFKKLSTAVKNELGANVKAYGLRKARDKDDADEITDLKNFEKLIAEYIKDIDLTLADAYKYGFEDTLVKFVFESNNEAAKKALATYGASKIRGIAETTMNQIRGVLIDAFEKDTAVTDIAAEIDEKFAEIESGRAETIARTETLTAVSMGREAKREEFKEQFPDAKLMKMWVSAQDERVRDSHQELDGKSVPVDDSFKDDLRFPRDPECNDPAEVINCRCTDITFAEEQQEAIEATLPAKEDEESDEG